MLLEKLEPVCLKCGSEDVELEWIEPGKEWDGTEFEITQESMRCYCNHCTYKWHIAPLIYDPAKDVIKLED